MQQYVHSSPRTRDTMSGDVLQSYILGHNFTKTQISSTVRPPADGEEADLLSIGGRSSQSSISEVSEVSSATPRRMDADGSVPLLPYERWKQSLENLLNDSEGFSVFKNFLIGRGEEVILECWLAMKGFRDFDRPRSSGNSSAASSTTGSLTRPNQASEEQLLKKLKLAKAIYKNYLANNSSKLISPIKSATKLYILNHIKAAAKEKITVEIDSNLFVEAQNEIELNLESTSYKNFLASNEFLKLTAQLTDSSSSKVLPQPNSSLPAKVLEIPADSATKLPDTGSSIPYLPRLVEDEVWNPSLKNQSNSSSTHVNEEIPHSSDVLSTSTSIPYPLGIHRSVNETSDAYPYFTPGNDYYVPPASAIGSDQASKSSDATSDTLSYTDNSSVDGKSYTCTRQGQKRLMRSHIKKNPTNALPDNKNHVPITSRKKTIPDLATKNPKEFFAQLNVKLLRVQEERKMQQRHVGFPFKKPFPPASDPIVSIKNEEEDMEEFLESHLNRVIQSPPAVRDLPVIREKQVRNHGNDGVDLQQNPRPGFGVVPALTRNEVPDVDTPVIPVDKNRMITAWIQTPATQQTKLKKKNRSVFPEEVPTGDHYVHPAESTGLQSGNRVRRRQLLIQDTNMPLLDQPDAITTIEEVKRRLMEETDESYEMPVLETLKLTSLPPPSDQITSSAVAASSSTPAAKPQLASTSNASNPAHDIAVVDSDTSSETTTLCNVNNISQEGLASTTVVYYMPSDKYPYRIKIPHCPVTLGQFKTALSRKGNFRYYFRQYSVDLQQSAYFEVSDDGEILPKFEGKVLAKVELNHV